MREDRPPSPYRGARVEELEEPLLPRWFVLLALALIPVALGVGIWAFVVFGPEEVPVAERRPPPPAGGALTTDVGGYDVGTSEAAPVATGCALTDGLRAAGSEADRERIALAAGALCDITLPEEAARRLRDFVRADGEVRFAVFQATGVDSTLEIGASPPRLLLNNRFAREEVDPLWIAPVLVHDTTWLEAAPGTAEGALEARRLEALVCERLLAEDRSRGCEDAAALLELADPVRALEAAGFG